MPGCSKPDEATVAVDQTKTDTKAVADNVGKTAADTWSSVKDFGFEKRTEFSAGIGRMAGQLDDKERDSKSASKADYDAARADLQSKLDDLNSATAATWNDAKQKTSDSWERLQAAYAKMTPKTAS